MQIDLTETELYILQKGMCLIRDSIRKPHEEMIAIHIQEKIRDALDKLESEKTYPVQAIFDSPDLYEWSFNGLDNTWFRFDNEILRYSHNKKVFGIQKSFLNRRYHRRERKNNE